MRNPSDKILFDKDSLDQYMKEMFPLQIQISNKDNQLIQDWEHHFHQKPEDQTFLVLDQRKFSLHWKNVFIITVKTKWFD